MTLLKHLKDYLSFTTLH